MDLADRIHQLAAQGNSKQQTMELLGFTRGRFDAVLELIPPVQWPARNRSNNARLANERRRGVFTPGMAKAQKLASAVEVAKLRLQGVACNTIATQYGISESLPREIVKGRCWKDALEQAKSDLGIN